MRPLTNRVGAFRTAVYETYTHDGLCATLLGIGWFLPTAVLEATIGATALTRPARPPQTAE